jgi:peptidoglycan hydrolase-like protein with peptidoglycan-binding domain
VAIVCNALFLQSGSHPAPFFANQTSQAAAGTARHKLAEQLAARQPPQAIPARLSDPIADLIGPSPRILAVQRILSDFGYGQIKLSGILDNATSSAIETFERDHKMPVTGQVTDRLVGELSTMTGRSAQ